MHSCDLGAARSQLDTLQVKKFQSIKRIIQEQHLAYVNDEHNLMLCSPVGNQELFGDELKANIVLSGFCVAPDAAIGFAEDLAKTSLRQATVDNAFNTPTMRRGIKKIFKSIGIKNDSALEESIHHDAVAKTTMRFLMTQMLCMISKDGGSKAADVTKLLEDHQEVRAQAERCLSCLVKRIEEKVEPGSIILLMGNDAFKLVNETELHAGNGNQCRIRLNEKMDGKSLLSYLERTGYKVLPVIHAAGIGYPLIEEDWYKKDERAVAHRSLLKRFGADAVEEVLPVFLSN